MKKVLALLVAVTLVSSSFAQYRSNDGGYNKGKEVYNDWGKNKNDNRDNDRYSYSTRERDLQIANINRNYDQQIREVNHKMFMSRSKKEKAIFRLEIQRREEIKDAYARFNDRRNRYDNSPARH